MQISSQEGYPGYENFVRLGHCKCFLDGELVTKAIAADEDAGTVVAWVLEPGTCEYRILKIKDDAEDGGYRQEVATEVLHGNVRLEFPKDRAANETGAQVNP